MKLRKKGGNRILIMNLSMVQFWNQISNTEKIDPKTHAQQVAEFFRTADAIIDDETQNLFCSQTLIVKQIDERGDPSASIYYTIFCSEQFQGQAYRQASLMGKYDPQRKDPSLPDGGKLKKQIGGI